MLGSTTYYSIIVNPNQFNDAVDFSKGDTYMACECDTLKELQSFGGYSHYDSTLQSMMNNVNNGFFKIISQDQFEIIFQCNNCNQRWKLGKPDFPVTGYFVKS